MSVRVKHAPFSRTSKTMDDLHELISAPFKTQKTDYNPHAHKTEELNRRTHSF
jgi:hypothetical protein